jgi:hypothetical protein
MTKFKCGAATDFISVRVGEVRLRNSRSVFDALPLVSAPHGSEARRPGSESQAVGLSVGSPKGRDLRNEARQRDRSCLLAGDALQSISLSMQVPESLPENLPWGTDSNTPCKYTMRHLNHQDRS